MKDMELSDNEIIEGLRAGDEHVTQEYFYGYCRMAYFIFDKTYGLKNKPGMDFYSLSHEYYLALFKHEFKQLEDKHADVSLKTWMINGFRFVVQDKLKAVAKEHRIESFEDRIANSHLCFDIPDANYRAEVRATINEICTRYYGRDTKEAVILQMLLIDGYKGKEIAVQLGITPAAISQRYHSMMEDVVIPYFRHNFEMPTASRSIFMDIDNRQLSDFQNHLESEFECYKTYSRIFNKAPMDYSNRITPRFVGGLQENEIFVFGSNLQGYHGGGAARIAMNIFGAVWGQGVGLQGKSYAIPTMQGGTETIQPYVDEFIEFAKQHQEMTFLVTAIGCGIAGFTPDDIAPLFKEAKDVENIHLPKEFWEFLQTI